MTKSSVLLVMVCLLLSCKDENKTKPLIADLNNNPEWVQKFPGSLGNLCKCPF